MRGRGLTLSSLLSLLFDTFPFFSTQRIALSVSSSPVFFPLFSLPSLACIVGPLHFPALARSSLWGDPSGHPSGACSTSSSFISV